MYGVPLPQARALALALQARLLEGFWLQSVEGWIQHQGSLCLEGGPLQTHRHIGPCFTTAQGRVFCCRH